MVSRLIAAGADANEKDKLRRTPLHLAAFAGLIILSGFLCFLLDRRFFAGLKPWMKVPLYTILGSAVCFAMTFAIVDVVNYAIGFFQSAVAKPIVESVHPVSAALGRAPAGSH